MKNIPAFTTENGVASLILREISWSGAAYARIQASQAPLALAAECAAFCRGCGAETVFAAGSDALSAYPLRTRILELCRSRAGIPAGEAVLEPVTEDTLGQWLSIFNRRMVRVPNAAHMAEREGEAMLARGDGYFVRREGVLLGIGIAAGERIDALAAVQPGAGEEVVRALCGVLEGNSVRLDAADANAPAMALYARMGFFPENVKSCWYTLPRQEKVLDNPDPMLYNT